MLLGGAAVLILGPLSPASALRVQVQENCLFRNNSVSGPGVVGGGAILFLGQRCRFQPPPGVEWSLSIQDTQFVDNAMEWPTNTVPLPFPAPSSGPRVFGGGAVASFANTTTIGCSFLGNRVQGVQLGPAGGVNPYFPCVSPPELHNLLFVSLFFFFMFLSSSLHGRASWGVCPCFCLYRWSFGSCGNMDIHQFNICGKHSGGNPDRSWGGPHWQHDHDCLCQRGRRCVDARGGCGSPPPSLLFVFHIVFCLPSCPLGDSSPSLSGVHSRRRIFRKCLSRLPSGPLLGNLAVRAPRTVWGVGSILSFLLSYCLLLKLL